MSKVPNDFIKFEKKLSKLGPGVMAQVVADAINIVAKKAHEDSRKNVQSKFVLRNKYTLNSVKMWQAKPRENWQKINAVTGSVSPYMDEQESGGTRRPVKGRKVPVSTMAARGYSATKVKRKKYKAGTEWDKEKYFLGKPKGQKKNAGKPSGLYERTNRNKKIRLITNLDDSSLRITAKRWHSDAIKKYNAGHIQKEFVRLAKIALKTQ